MKGEADRNFKIVDFGLSKFFVIPEPLSVADKERPWTGRWMPVRPVSSVEQGTVIVVDGKHDDHATTMTTSSGGCVRLERNLIEFRGTSMYASLRGEDCAVGGSCHLTWRFWNTKQC